MTRSEGQLRSDALAIWQAGVEAVRSDRLILENVRVETHWLHVVDELIDLRAVGRIAVVGAGKAGAGMAAGLEQALGSHWMQAKQLTGWVQVPADCVRPLSRITLHAARPAGVNEPTPEGVAGTQRILEIVAGLQPNDLCLCLLSGGGSALLPAPIDGVTLADKQALTRFLSGAGANIRELNTVRKQLSRIKGGGLARACTAGRLITIVISDVIGDPLDVIASGPTVENPTTVDDALRVLDKFAARAAGVAPRAVAVLEHRRQFPRPPDPPDTCRVTNLVVGNNAVAVDAAGIEAERRGYSHAMHATNQLEGAAEDVGRHLAAMAARMRVEPGPDCLITGGEPTVQLVPPPARGSGGRNQQLALAALQFLLDQDAEPARYGALHVTETAPSGIALSGIAILSGGTDGEDGPTEAAGALVDAGVVRSMRAKKLRPLDFLLRNDAYHFFEATGGLITTGPTHTNVCDLRVVVTARIEVATPSKS